jgi:hypothetical protein
MTSVDRAGTRGTGIAGARDITEEELRKRLETHNIGRASWEAGYRYRRGTGQVSPKKSSENGLEREEEKQDIGTAGTQEKIAKGERGRWGGAVRKREGELEREKYRMRKTLDRTSVKARAGTLRTEIAGASHPQESRKRQDIGPRHHNGEKLNGDNVMQGLATTRRAAREVRNVRKRLRETKIGSAWPKELSGNQRRSTCTKQGKATHRQEISGGRCVDTDRQIT